MPKTIKIQSSAEQYKLFCDESEIISIPKNNLTVDGKKLFDNFISKLDITKKVKFQYQDDPSITDSNEIRIIKDLKTVLDSIASKINEKFKLKDEAPDNSEESNSQIAA